MKERGILFSGAMVRALLSGAKTQTRRVVHPRLYIELNDGDPEAPSGCILQNDPAFGEALPRFVHCPYGAPGDRLWVRETWAVASTLGPVEFLYGPLATHGIRKYGGGGPEPGCHLRVRSGDAFVAYKANPNSPQERDVLQAQVARNEHGGQDFGWRWNAHLPRTWRPSIHMPRWASRITLEVTEVRVQRLQDISEEDARAEGITGPHDVGYQAYRVPDDSKPRYSTAAAGFECLWDSINGDRASWASNPFVWAVSFRMVS